MILVIAELTVKEGHVEQFLKAAEACIAQTRKENGNIAYELMSNAFNRHKFSFVEQWASKEALDSHMATDHFKTFMAATPNLLVADSTLNVYNAEKL